MKTKEEIVNGIVARFANEIGNVYEAGRAWEQSNPFYWHPDDVETAREEAYLSGLKDAWGTVKRIEYMTDTELYDAFGTCDWEELLNVPARVAVEMLKAYDERTQEEGEAAKGDIELQKWCERQPLCEQCLMKNVFPSCGNGWHVYMATGKENEAAHKIMEASKALEEGRKKS